MEALSEYYGIDERGIRLKVERARERGYLICSGNTGYYLPATSFELAEYFYRTLSSIRTALRTLLPFWVKMKRMEMIMDDRDNELFTRFIEGVADLGPLED